MDVIKEEMDDDEKKTGFVIEKGNYNEYIDKISILINDEEKRQEMGNEEYKFVKNNFTWKVAVKEFVSVINEKHV